MNLKIQNRRLEFGEEKVLYKYCDVWKNFLFYGKAFASKICRSFFTVLYTPHTLSYYLKFHFLCFKNVLKMTSEHPPVPRGQQVSVNPDKTILMSTTLHSCKLLDVLTC